MIYHPRTEWQTAAQPVTGPILDRAPLVDMVYHYPGSGPNAKYNNPVIVLRAMQNDYLTNRGYSLGYNWAIDPKGDIWEIRGFDIRSAATGGWNTQSVATMFLVPGIEQASRAQLDAAVELHKECNRRWTKALRTKGHFQCGTTATPCPGAGIKFQLPVINDMVYADPVPAPVPPFGDDMKTILIYTPGNPVQVAWDGITAVGISSPEMLDAGQRNGVYPPGDPIAVTANELQQIISQCCVRPFNL